MRAGLPRCSVGGRATESRSSSAIRVNLSIASAKGKGRPRGVFGRLPPLPDLPVPARGRERDLPGVRGGVHGGGGAGVLGGGGAVTAGRERAGVPNGCRRYTLRR